MVINVRRLIIQVDQVRKLESDVPVRVDVRLDTTMRRIVGPLVECLLFVKVVLDFSLQGIIRFHVDVLSAVVVWGVGVVCGKAADVGARAVVRTN